MRRGLQYLEYPCVPTMDFTLDVMEPPPPNVTDQFLRDVPSHSLPQKFVWKRDPHHRNPFRMT